MAKTSMGFAKGIGAGIAAGMTVGIVGSQMMMRDKRHFKRNAGKAVHAIGDLIDNVQYMFK
jgi:hypothetical protein